MKWELRLQKLGRIQIPTAFLKAYNYGVGQQVLLEDDRHGRILTIKFVRKKRKVKRQ